jgi:hypothetical protein
MFSTPQTKLQSSSAISLLIVLCKNKILTQYEEAKCVVELRRVSSVRVDYAESRDHYSAVASVE